MSFSLKNKSTWVIKIGSSILTTEQGEPDLKIFHQLASDIAHLNNRGHRVVVVSSGAIACGMHKLGFKRKPSLIPQKQAIAAAGQIYLMNLYEKVFSKLGLNIAQILLTRDDLAHRERYLNARNAIHELFQLGLIPIINENDTVVVEEIKVGDNDNLAALVTNVVEADLLVILTDQNGLYTADPRKNSKAERVPKIHKIDQAVRALAEDTKRAGTTGGMITKLEAAAKAASYGVPTIIASGKQKEVLTQIALQNDVGTLILPQDRSTRLSRRKHWMNFALKPMGQIVVDPGAKEVVTQKGKSLLPAGVKKVIGSFKRGDPVDLLLEGEKPFARGLVSYSAQEIEKIKGEKSSKIQEKLGYQYLEEVIHRNELVLLNPE